MTGYQIALALHLLALVAAASASGIVHFAAARRTAAPTLRESLEWERIMGATARVFPISVLVLIATGSYMVAGQWQWSAGWVMAGLGGALFLLVSGAVIGIRSAARARANAARLQAAGRELANDGAPDRVAHLLSEVNTGVAVAIVAAMALKLGLAGSLALLVVGAAVGAYQVRAGRHAVRAAQLAEEVETGG